MSCGLSLTTLAITAHRAVWLHTSLSAGQGRRPVAYTFPLPDGAMRRRAFSFYLLRRGRAAAVAYYLPGRKRDALAATFSFSHLRWPLGQTRPQAGSLPTFAPQRDALRGSFSFARAGLGQTRPPCGRGLLTTQPRARCALGSFFFTYPAIQPRSGWWLTL